MTTRQKGHGFNQVGYSNIILSIYRGLDAYRLQF